MEVDALSLEVAEMREKEELVDELCKQMDDVEVELNRKQEEVSIGDHQRLLFSPCLCILFCN